MSAGQSASAGENTTRLIGLSQTRAKELLLRLKEHSNDDTLFGVRYLVEEQDCVSQNNSYKIGANFRFSMWYIDVLPSRNANRKFREIKKEEKMDGARTINCKKKKSRNVVSNPGRVQKIIDACSELLTIDVLDMRRKETELAVSVANRKQSNKLIRNTLPQI